MTVPAVADEGMAIIRKWEGWHDKLPDGRAAPYWCPARVATIGFGTTRWRNGSPVRITDEPITKEFGIELLNWQVLRTYAAAVDRATKRKIHPFMRAACISLCYNIGAAAFRNSTVCRRINQGRYEEAAAAFKMWRIGGGRVLSGLVARRQDEMALFMRGVRAITVEGVAYEAPPLPSRKPNQSPGLWSRFVAAIMKAFQ